MEKTSICAISEFCNSIVKKSEDGLGKIRTSDNSNSSRLVKIETVPVKVLEQYSLEARNMTFVHEDGLKYLRD